MNVLLVSRVFMLVLQSAYCLSQHLWPDCHRTERFHTACSHFSMRSLYTAMHVHIE